ncbi:aldolase/citrate lyase family protein, partial [Chloroflexota bacterium]
HRRLHIHPVEEETPEQYALRTAGVPEPYIIPVIESEETIANTDKIAAIDGLKIFGLGLSDASRLLTGSANYDHPKVWEFVDKVVELAEPRGIVVCANTGYGKSAWHITRLKSLVQHGVRMIWLSQATYLLQEVLEDMMKQIKAEVPGV